MSIYCVRATNSVGRVVLMASRATVDEALTEAGSVLSRGSAFVWIVDGDGNLILPAVRSKPVWIKGPERREISLTDRLTIAAPVRAA